MSDEHPRPGDEEAAPEPPEPAEPKRARRSPFIPEDYEAEAESDDQDECPAGEKNGPVSRRDRR